MLRKLKISTSISKCSLYVFATLSNISIKALMRDCDNNYYIETSHYFNGIEYKVDLIINSLHTSSIFSNKLPKNIKIKGYENNCIIRFILEIPLSEYNNCTFSMLPDKISITANKKNSLIDYSITAKIDKKTFIQLVKYSDLRSILDLNKKKDKTYLLKNGMTGYPLQGGRVSPR